MIVTVRMLFGTPACDPLNPLRDEIAGARLGQFTVDPQLDIYPPVLIPTTRPTARTNSGKKIGFKKLRLVVVASSLRGQGKRPQQKLCIL